MSLEIDRFFPARRYPEFSIWHPVMTDTGAGKYVGASVVKRVLYHATFPDRAESIRSGGVDISRSTPTVFFAAGHYMAADIRYAEDYFGSVVLPQKLLIKRPFKIASPLAFEEWLRDEGLNFLPERVRARAATLLLLDRGFDGMRILRDSEEVPRSEAWLAFHPRQVVTLCRG